MITIDFSPVVGVFMKSGSKGDDRTRELRRPVELVHNQGHKVVEQGGYKSTWVWLPVLIIMTLFQEGLSGWQRPAHDVQK